MGSRDFKTHLLYYHFLVITCKNKSISPDGLDLSISVQGHRLCNWDFFGSNRTEDLLVALQLDRV